MWKSDSPAFDARLSILDLERSVSKKKLADADEETLDAVLPFKTVAQLVRGLQPPSADDLFEACESAITRLKSSNAAPENKDELISALEEMRDAVKGDVINTKNEAAETEEEDSKAEAKEEEPATSDAD